jgi:NADH:ubiquinone oxidoreductase subunit H
MRLGWKVLIPVTLVWISLIGIVRFYVPVPFLQMYFS